MEFALDPHHYRTVPAVYWPVLFLRLWAFFWWQKQHGQAVIFSITPDGRILVRYIEDDPASFSGWAARNAAERPHLLALDNGDGVLGVNPIVILVARWLERFGGREIWLSARRVLGPIPPFLDSSQGFASR